MNNGRHSVLRRIIPLLLCAVLLPALACPAFADGEEAADSLIDAERMQAIVDELIAEHSVNGNNFSIGYCYLATGDTWFYNNDRWYYAASVYKVPLMMLVAEKVAAGELTQDSEVTYGISLAEEEELILTYSNNDYARDIRFNYFGGDEAWVEQAKKYSDMPDEDYDPNYLSYRYYNAQYIVDVLRTLYNEPDRFPNVINCLLNAEPRAYFRSTLDGQYEIAQKYGAYIENDSTNNNHTVGIIYTPNPIVVAVMTKNIGGYESFIGDAARLLTEYTLELDSELEAYNKAQEEAAEQARLEAEEAQRQAEEEAQREKEAEEQRLAEARMEAEEAARKAAVKKRLLIGGAAAAAVAAVVLVIVFAGRKTPKKRQKVSVGRNNTDNYRPKH